MPNHEIPSPTAVWVDGDPLMEAIAAAVWEQCGRSDSGSCVEDDPRTIAAVAAAVSVPPPATRADDQAAVLREAAKGLLRLRDSLITEPDVTGKYLAGIERSAAELHRAAAVSGPCVAGEQQNETRAVVLLATPCDACEHTLNWHRNDVGCMVRRCVCGRFQPPTGAPG